MYRPKGWEKIRKDIADDSWMLPNQTEFPIVIPSSFEFDLLKRNLVEAGADAMLELVLSICRNQQEHDVYNDDSIFAYGGPNFCEYGCFDGLTAILEGKAVKNRYGQWVIPEEVAR